MPSGIDLSSSLVFGQSIGSGSAALSSAAVTPEPQSLLLLIIMLLAKLAVVRAR